jgi:Protein of unknown function (DUF3096)
MSIKNVAGGLAPDWLLHCRRGARGCTIHNAPYKEYQAMMMTMRTHLSPLVALIVGILILIFPRFLNYFIAIYLIVTGLIGLGALRAIGSP